MTPVAVRVHPQRVKTPQEKPFCWSAGYTYLNMVGEDKVAGSLPLGIAHRPIISVP